MRKRAENPDTAPAPAGRYSQVVRLDVGDGALLLLSGQVATDSDNHIVAPGDMAAQTRQVFEHIGAILKSQGATFDDIVNIRTYLTDIGQLSSYAAVRRTYITGPEPPTSTTVEVSALFRPEAVVEVEVSAVVRS